MRSKTLALVVPSLSATNTKTQSSSITTQNLTEVNRLETSHKIPLGFVVTMATIIGRLPPELHIHLVKFLPACADILAIAQTSKQNYQNFNYLAYELAASLPQERGARIVFWAAAKGFTRVIEAAHEAKISTDRMFCRETSYSVGPLDYLPIERVDHSLRLKRWGWFPFDGPDEELELQSTPISIVSAPIHLAVQAGQLEVVQQLLMYGADQTATCSGVCGCDYDKEYFGWFTHSPRLPDGTLKPRVTWSLLHIALCSDQISIAELFLSQNPIPAMTSEAEGSTALHAVSRSGNLGFAKGLINTGHACEVNQQDWRGFTPIMYAYAWDRLEIVRYLLSIGADINKTVEVSDFEEEHVEITILSDAICKGRFSLALELLDVEGIEHGDALYYMSFTRRDAQYSILEGIESEKESTLLAKQIMQRLLNSVPENPGSDLLSQCLAVAAKRGNLLAVQILVHFGVDINRACTGPYRDRVRGEAVVETPLYRAVYYMLTGLGDTFRDKRPSYLPTIKYLLENGANPVLRFESNRSVLKLSIDYSYDEGTEAYEIAMLLIKYGAHSHRGTYGQFVPDYHDESALEKAMVRAWVDLFTRLLEACDPSALTEDDFLGLWWQFTLRVAYYRNGFERMMMILELDANRIIAKRAENSLRELLGLWRVPISEDIFFRLLDQGAEIVPDYGDLKTALSKKPKPTIIRALLDRMPSTNSSMHRMKRGALRGVVSNKDVGSDLTGWYDSDLDSNNGVLSNAKTILERENRWRCAIVAAFLETGSLAHEATLKSGRSLFEIVMEGPATSKPIAKLILNKQPLGHYPHVDASRYIRRMCENGDFSMLKSVVASAKNGKGIVKSEATSLSVVILKSAPRGANTVHNVFSILRCLEYVFKLSDGGAFDVPSPAIDLLDGPPALEEKRARMKRVATARQARALLRHRMDVMRCGNDRAQAALTWIFNKKIEFRYDPCGKTRPIFKSGSYAALLRAYRDCILEIFLDDDGDWLRHLAVVYDFEA